MTKEGVLESISFPAQPTYLSDVDKVSGEG